jgi:hypothetical protein
LLCHKSVEAICGIRRFLVIAFKFVIRIIIGCFERIDEEVDVGEILVVRGSKSINGTLQIVPIKYTLWGKGTFSSCAESVTWWRRRRGAPMGIRGEFIPKTDRSGME